MHTVLLLFYLLSPPLLLSLTLFLSSPPLSQVLSNGSLLLPAATPEDNGLFQCSLQIGDASVDSQTQLLIQVSQGVMHTVHLPSPTFDICSKSSTCDLRSYCTMALAVFLHSTLCKIRTSGFRFRVQFLLHAVTSASMNSWFLLLWCFSCAHFIALPFSWVAENVA